jgi:hypothetical protein
MWKSLLKGWGVTVIIAGKVSLSLVHWKKFSWSIKTTAKVAELKKE